MNKPVKVLTEPTKLRGGAGVVRVVAKEGDAVPEKWTGAGCEEVDGSYLADLLNGTPLSIRELEELGIFAADETAILNELNAHFPAANFIIDKQSFNVGSSFTIRWTDGPTKRRVEEVIGSSNRVYLERELSERFVERIDARLNNFYRSRPWGGDRWSLINQAAEDATLFAKSKPSPELRAFIDAMTGVWDVEGCPIAVFPSKMGGLEAKSLITGKTVGAGLAFGGHKIGDLPEGFDPNAS